MKLRNPFPNLTKFERTLWLSSVGVVLACFFLSGMQDIWSTLASLLGVTALIFLAKGAWQGQVLCILFALAYSAVSFRLHYYGEMITYLCMSLPMAVFSLVSWIRNPYQKGEVKVARLTRTKLLILSLGVVLTTVAFYFVLQVLGTASLPVSTISVGTSFTAAALNFYRSPYFALGYAANDIVLIVLWIIASLTDFSNLPMVACFFMFFFNDIYSFVNWRRMQKKQASPSQK